METPSALNDRYHVTSHLARGGMADVYEGTDTLLNRTVAIKVLHAQFSVDEAFVKRFRREAQAAANLSHHNIVGIYDWGQAQNTYFIVMELVDGRSLRDVLKSEGALLPRRATEIAAETASALSVAHQAGLVHRDVKPGNILLAKDGTVKVTDFGIARAFDDSQELTRTGAVIGTATYFSPEQAQGDLADARSDVYALGVVLYEMLTGRPPYIGDSPMAVAFQHVSTEAPAPSTLNPDVPPELDAVVMKAMRKDPEARYQTAEELRQDLLAVLAGEPVEVVAAPLVPAVNNVEESATRVLTTPMPAATATSDEVYRQVEEEPPSQIPFILVASALLIGLGILLFAFFNWTLRGQETQVSIPDVAGLTQLVAFQRLVDADLVVDLPPGEPSDEVEAGRVIRTEPGAGELVAPGSTVFLFVSSGPAESVVPPLIGETLERALQLIEEAGLERGEITDRPDANFEDGVVIDQDPSSGQSVLSGTEVNLVISTGVEEVEVPDVVGQTERNATDILNDADLNRIVNEERSDEVEAGLVIRTDPEPGTMVNVGSTVLLVVSQGPPDVSVPDLSGMTQQEATEELQGVGLVPNFSATRQPVDDEEMDGRVVNQIPVAGQTVSHGTTVTITLGDYQPPPTTTTTTTIPTTTTTEPANGETDPPNGDDGGS